MTKITLEKREITGKKVKQLRADNKVPAVVYDSSKASTNVTAKAGEIERMLRTATTSTIVDLDLDGKATKALIKAVDYDPVKGDIKHVEFFEINENHEFDIEIPFEIIGVSPAVKNNLGVLIQPTLSLDVRCKLKAIVPTIQIDISELDTVGQTITVDDIKLPEGMELIREEQKDLAIVAITELQAELEAIETADTEQEATEAETTVQGGDADGEGEEAAE